MNNKKQTSMSTQKLTLLALFTALVAILSYMGGFIKIGSLASISLTLIPVVLGAALCGPWAGAWLGGVSGAVFFATADAAFWLGLSIPGTIITVMIKGILSGLFAGLTYKLLEKANKDIAVVASAIICPIVNTGIFLLGCLIFFMDAVKDGAAGKDMSAWGYMLVVFVGLNFVFELLTNVVFSPIIVRLLNIRNNKTSRA